MRKILIPLLLTACIQSFSQLPERFQDEKTNKFGFKDKTGKVIVKPVYDIAHEFDGEKYTLVNIGASYTKNKGGKWGAINAQGKLIIPVIYDNAHYLGYGLFAMNKGHKFSNMDATPSGKFAIFNASGKALTPFAYSGFLSAVRFDGGFAPLETFDGKVQKYGLLDSTGKVIVPAKYDAVGVFNDGLCVVSLNNKSGYLNKSGKFAIPMKYEGARSFSDGLASVKLGGKWGFIDMKEKTVIGMEYEDAKSFEEGYAAVKKNGKWGIIDRSNTNIVDFTYDDIIWIKNKGNEIRVKKGGKYVNVDRQGNELKS